MVALMVLGVLGWVMIVVLAMLTFGATLMTAGVRFRRRRRSRR